MKIFDVLGNERDWAWLEAKYGPLVIHVANPGPGWRLAEIREDADLPENVSVTWGIAPMAAPTIMVKLLAADGRPAVDMPVAWYWPDAPRNEAGMPSNGLPVGMVWGRADGPGITNLNGDVGFAMGRGGYYFPPEIGPHATWVWGANSDVVLGLGMKGATNHDHLNVVFQQWSGEPEPHDWRASVMAALEMLGRVSTELAAITGDVLEVEQLLSEALEE